MRWEKKTKRRKTRFLFIPKCIKSEWRWLEKATWYEEYEAIWRGDFSSSIHGYYEYIWNAKHWIDDANRT